MSCKGEWLSAVMMQPHQVAGLQKLQRLPPAPPAAAPRATIGAILLSLSAAPHTEVCRLPREEGASSAATLATPTSSALLPGATLLVRILCW